MALLLLDYAALRLNSSLGMLYVHLSSTHFAVYMGLTFATAIAFGINTSIFIYHIKRYGLKNIISQSGGGLGAVIGIFASSCPVCGTTLLSLVGIAGSLSSLPFQGLELKALAFVLILASLLFSIFGFRQKQCTEGVCPVALNVPIKQSEQLSLSLVLLLLVFLGVRLFATDIIHSPKEMESAYICNEDET